MLSRTGLLRSYVALTFLALVTTLGPAGPAQADATRASAPASTKADLTASSTHAAAKARKDPRRSRGLFVDPYMPANNNGKRYASRIGKYAQALWIIPEAYSTKKVRGIVRGYTSRALKAKKTPMLVIYGIPDRDCQQHSSGGLSDAAAYRAWVKKIGKGLKGQDAMVVLEPDALPFIGDPRCQNTGNRLKMLSFASKRLAKAGAWVYIDAGHSDWRPFDTRPALLKRAGIRFARGFSTNVSNFRTTGSEKKYAATLLRGLKKLGIKGKRYVIDTSRNGISKPVAGDVYNPSWARIGAKPKLAFKGAFDGTLWVKHPGESDGPVNDGPSSGVWCDRLADRLLDLKDSGHC